MKAFGIRFANGDLFNSFARSEAGADTLRKHVERLAREFDPELPDLNPFPIILGPLPCEVVPIEIEVKK